MNASPNLSLCVWRLGTRPILAYASGSRSAKRRALELFPRNSCRRHWLYAAINILALAGLERFLTAQTTSAGALLDVTEIYDLLEAVCQGGVVPRDWLLLWPARIERERLYLVFRAASAAQMGVIKMGAGPANARRLMNEANTLRQLAGQPHPFTIPSVLWIKELSGERTALALGGFPSHGRTPRRTPATIWSERVLAHLASLEPKGIIHGDLGPGNMALAADGGLFLFDWEHSAVGQLALIDRLGFWLSLRQRQVVRHPLRWANKLKEEFTDFAETDRVRSVEYLAALDNLAAQKIREVWM